MLKSWPLSVIQNQDASQKLKLIGQSSLNAANDIIRHTQEFYKDHMVQTKGQENVISQNEAPGIKRAYMNLGICDKVEGEPLSKISLKIDLFEKAMPKTCENFLKLCQGITDPYDNIMAYKDSIIYEIIPGWVIVGGDFVNNNGSGGKSIYKEGFFEDEGFSAADYSEPGQLCMLNYGPNTNNSIFFITLKPAPWLNGVHVAFGKVAEGLQSLQKLSEQVGTPSGIPSKIVKIFACGSC